MSTEHCFGGFLLTSLDVKARAGIVIRTSAETNMLYVPWDAFLVSSDFVIASRLPAHFSAIVFLFSFWKFYWRILFYCFCFLVLLADTSTGTPVLDFWWCLLWISQPEWVLKVRSLETTLVCVGSAGKAHFSNKLDTCAETTSSL